MIDTDTYCNKCGGCGIVACDGITAFLDTHVRGKTDCTQEASFIAEIIEALDEDAELTVESEEI